MIGVADIPSLQATQYVDDYSQNDDDMRRSASAATFAADKLLNRGQGTHLTSLVASLLLKPDSTSVNMWGRGTSRDSRACPGIGGDMLWYWSHVILFQFRSG